MPNIVEISGNFIEVADKLGPKYSYLYETQEKSNYIDQIGADLNRTHYVSFSHNVDTLKAKALETHHLEESNVYSYTQGNLTGRNFFQGVYTTGRILEPYWIEAVNANDKIFDDLEMSYIDDNGQLCALCISYVRNDWDYNHFPAEKRPMPYVVTIIKNTNLEPRERKVFHFCHRDLISLLKTEEYIDKYEDYFGYIEDKEQFRKDNKAQITTDTNSFIKDQKTIKKNSIPARIASLINSRNISALIEGVFDGKNISKDKFSELKDRTIEGRNIDDRDNKITELNKQLKQAIETNPKSELLNQLKENIKNSIANDINFFKEENFQKTGEHLEFLTSLESNRNEGDLNNDLNNDFLYNYQLFKEISQNTKEKQLRDKSIDIIKNIEKLTGIAKFESSSDIAKWDNLGEYIKPSDSQDVEDLNAVLKNCINVSLNYKKPDNSSQASITTSLSQLASLSNKVSGKASPGWKALGIAIGAFAVLTVVASVLAAVVTGGTGLLVAGIGVSMLSGVLAVASYSAGQEKGLAESTSSYRKVLKELRNDLNDDSSNDLNDDSSNNLNEDLSNNLNEDLSSDSNEDLSSEKSPEQSFKI